MSKRKSNGSTDVDEKQLFIRNLDYSVTSDEVTSFFETIGPIKYVSIATDSSGGSKGFGFVKFAFEDDAKAAKEKLHNTLLKDRKIVLEFGLKTERNNKKKGSPDNEEADEVVEEEKVEKKTTESVPKKPQPITENRDDQGSSGANVKRHRQLVVFGVPIDVNKKIFRFVLSKISRSALVELVKEDHPLSAQLGIVHPAGKIVLITATSKQDAQKIQDALNMYTIQTLGFIKSIEKAKGGVKKGDEEQPEDDNDAEPSNQESSNTTSNPLSTQSMLKNKLVCRKLSDVVDDQLRKKQSRVIIRNLSFQANEQNILIKLGKFGPITEVELPREEVVKGAKRASKRGDSADKGKEAGEQQLSLRPKGFAFVTFLCARDAQSSVEQSEGLKICNREVAIDFSVSKNAFQKGQEQEVVGTDKEVKDKDEDNDEKADGEEEEVDEAENDEEESNSDDDKDTKEADAVEGEQQKSSDAKEGRTVFLRGLSFDTTAQDVKQALRRFGDIELAILVKDRSTGQSKGTAFVKFAEQRSAEACLSFANRSSVAAPAKGAPAIAAGIMINDRSCKVNLAVARDEMQQIVSQQQQLKSRDKRNIYLANEGLVVRESGDDAKEADNDESNVNKVSLNAYDREKRQRAQSEKKKKLQNPLFFVSSTRLSIRSLSKKISTDHALKVLCLKAAKRGLDKKLVSQQDMVNQLIAQGENPSLQDVTVPVFVKNCVKTAKVMLDMDRVRGKVDAKGKASKGFGFVEFSSHACALAALRELNHNIEYVDDAIDSEKALDRSQKSRLIVEFSLENIRKVKILKDRQQRQESSKQQQGDGDDSDMDVDEVKEKPDLKKKRAREHSAVTSNSADHKDVEAVETPKQQPNKKQKVSNEATAIPTEQKEKKVLSDVKRQFKQNTIKQQNEAKKRKGKEMKTK